MKKQELLRRKEYLEENNQKLAKELVDLDKLMLMAGFSGGLTTVKLTAEEIVRYAEERNEISYNQMPPSIDEENFFYEEDDFAA